MNHYISHTHMIEKQTKRKYMLFKSSVKDFFNSVVLENGLENRVGQRILAYDVSKAIVSTKYLIGEAGVGIGKSFAYIIPLLYYNKYFDKPIVISTSTIALQEQIFIDIAVASDLINYHPEVMNAKGQNHYVCRKRAAQLFSDKHLPGEIMNQIRNGALIIHHNIKNSIVFMIKQQKQDKRDFRSDSSLLQLCSVCEAAVDHQRLMICMIFHRQGSPHRYYRFL